MLKLFSVLSCCALEFFQHKILELVFGKAGEEDTQLCPGPPLIIMILFEKKISVRAALIVGKV